MSYTLTIEPEIVKAAESCAIRNGTTLDDEVGSMFMGAMP